MRGHWRPAPEPERPETAPSVRRRALRGPGCPPESAAPVSRRPGPVSQQDAGRAARVPRGLVGRRAGCCRDRGRAVAWVCPRGASWTCPGRCPPPVRQRERPRRVPPLRRQTPQRCRPRPRPPPAASARSRPRRPAEPRAAPVRSLRRCRQTPPGSPPGPGRRPRPSPPTPAKALPAVAGSTTWFSPASPRSCSPHSRGTARRRAAVRRIGALPYPGGGRHPRIQSGSRAAAQGPVSERHPRRRKGRRKERRVWSGPGGARRAGVS